MEPISNVDRIVMLLRQKLEERSRATQGRSKAGPTSRKATSIGSVVAARALAELDSIDERLLHRSFVQNALAEHFGEELINDAQFQQAIERVTDAIQSDAKARILLDRAIKDLRAG